LVQEQVLSCGFETCHWPKVTTMLRAAIRAPARASLNRGGFGRPDLRSTRVRRNCQTSRPCRAAEAPKGDGISHEIHYEGLWGAITTFPKRKPYLTNIIVATVKTAFADYLVQTSEGKTSMDTYDFKRTAVFTSFGFAYLGVAQWFVYVTVFTRVCPNAVRFSNLSWAAKLKDRPGQIDLVKQTLLDNFVHYTFIYFPVFYCFKELVQGDGIGVHTVKNACAKYYKNCVSDNLAIWALWIPMDLIIYAVPVWMRLPLNHSVSMVWTMILSWMRGAEK